MIRVSNRVHLHGVRLRRAQQQHYRSYYGAVRIVHLQHFELFGNRNYFYPQVGGISQEELI